MFTAEQVQEASLECIDISSSYICKSFLCEHSRIQTGIHTLFDEAVVLQHTTYNRETKGVPLPELVQ
jgi:hypothetical protein